MTEEERDEILRKRYSILTYDEVTNFAINMRTLLAIIGEVLVDESKQHITSECAIDEIRDYMNKHQFDTDIDQFVLIKKYE